MPPPLLPDEVGAVFLAQLTALALVQLWKTGRQVSRQELGNQPKPAHDGIHLILTALALVVGLVMLITWVSHPIRLEYFAANGNAVIPAVAFSAFAYAMFVIGIRSSHRTSGDTSDPWIGGLSLLAATLLLLAVVVFPFFLLPHTQVPRRYQTWLALLIGICAVVGWQRLSSRRQKRQGPLS